MQVEQRSLGRLSLLLGLTSTLHRAVAIVGTTDGLLVEQIVENRVMWAVVHVS